VDADERNLLEELPEAEDLRGLVIGSGAMATTEDDLYELASSGMSDPQSQIKFLAYRVSVLTREKESLEVRVAKMEKSFNMGAGILLVMPVLGSAIGLILAFGKIIFAPWYKSP
jgi:hypothetical protein